jgi:ABC-2 type transport system permease protein
MTEHTSSMQRIGALALRHYYVLRRSPFKIFELFYWPFLNMVVWGFITVYLRMSSNGFSQALGIFLGAVILWEILTRSHLGVMLSFLEELYSRNLGHLFVSPLRPYELIASCTLVSVLRAMLGILPSALMMIPLFGYSIFAMGLPFAAFYFLLSMFGFAFGTMIIAILIRWGLSAESFAWAAMFLFTPIAGVYYPVAALPTWLQPVAWSLPTAYIFEGMRTLVLTGVVRWDYMAKAAMLDGVLFALAFGFFLWMFHIARVRGLLLNAGQ